MKKIYFVLLSTLFFLGYAVTGVTDDSVIEGDNSTIEVGIDELLDENTWLKKQVVSLNNLLKKKDKSLKKLSQRVSLLHEELITQNQIEEQLLRDLAFVADRMLSEENGSNEKWSVEIKPAVQIIEQNSIAEKPPEEIKSVNNIIEKEEETEISGIEIESASNFVEKESGTEKQPEETESVANLEERGNVVDIPPAEPKSVNKIVENVEVVETKVIIAASGLENKNSESTLNTSSYLFDPKTEFTAATFRIVDDVELIDENNQVQMFWDKGKSFTARELHGDFYKVSGYFVNSKWESAKTKLFIPVSVAVRR